jgi:hypothetical protein
MKNKGHSLNILLIGMILLSTIVISGCIEKEKMTGTGVIKYIDIEGGFYGIFSNDGQKYDPLNLPSEFKQDGLNVRFTFRIAKNAMGIHMWGKLIYILEIEIVDTKGTLINHTDCKESFDDGSPKNFDCIEYDYNDEGLLLLKHVNAGFNCCPEITANITIIDSKINIKEIELSGDCDCLCLFDVYYSIKDLNPGEYTISVEEPYIREDEETLEFEVDLTSPISGNFCVERYHYPWTD